MNKIDVNALLLVRSGGETHLGLLAKEGNVNKLTGAMLVGKDIDAETVKDYIMANEEDKLDTIELEGSVAIQKTKLTPEQVNEFNNQIAQYGLIEKVALAKLKNYLFQNGGNFQ